MRPFLVALIVLGTIGIPALSATPPSSLACTFEGGSKLAFDQEKLVGIAKSNDEKSRFIFSEMTSDKHIGVFRSVTMGWEGQVDILKNDEKYDLIEKTLSDNGFVVTIFFNKRFGKFIPAVYSQHILAPEIADFLPRQQIGMCE